MILNRYGVYHFLNNTCFTNSIYSKYNLFKIQFNHVLSAA